MIISYYDPTTTNNATYAYDAMQRRISKVVNSITEKYILDGSNVIADYNGSDVLQAEYVTPLLDENLIISRSSSTYYYMQDGLGSARNLINSSEVTQNTYDYYAFGESLSWTQNVTNRYTYTGREWDTESRRYYYRARQYSPSTGRFNRRDPIGYLAGLNLYTYVNNNPINLIDSLGLCAEPSRKHSSLSSNSYLVQNDFYRFSKAQCPSGPYRLPDNKRILHETGIGMEATPDWTISDGIVTRIREGIVPCDTNLLVRSSRNKIVESCGFVTIAKNAPGMCLQAVSDIIVNKWDTLCDRVDCPYAAIQLINDIDVNCHKISRPGLEVNFLVCTVEAIIQCLSIF